MSAARTQILCAGILTAFCAKAAVANVYDKRRTDADMSVYPEQTIGVLMLPDPAEGTTQSGGSCTATLVSRDLILTARHCLTDDTTGELIKTGYEFYLAVQDGGYDDSSSATYVLSGDADLNGEDWAFLRLSKPLGDTYGFMGIDAIDLSGMFGQPNYTMVAYSDDWKNLQTPSYETHCQFTAFQWNGTVKHDCDARPGASGAPIFYRDGNGHWNIVAIDIAELLDHGTHQSFPDGVAYSADTANVATPAMSFYKPFENFLSRNQLN